MIRFVCHHSFFVSYSLPVANFAVILGKIMVAVIILIPVAKVLIICVLTKILWLNRN